MTLKNLILDRIRLDGPLSFDHFMDLALYHRDGFFGGEQVRSTRGGDFLTSPEVSPLFGETLAKYVAGELERLGDPFALVEVGAGSGSLLRPLLEVLDVEAWAVERSPAARIELAALIGDGRVVSSVAELPAPFRGVVLANELIDNLPMAIAQKTSGGWRERWVGADGLDLIWIDSDPRPDVVTWLTSHAGEVVDEGWVEVQLQARQWLIAVMGSLEEGSLLLFDYGDTKEGLASRRQQGTLRTYRSHHLGPHPFDRPGETDITADVNFSALVATAAELGAEDIYLMRQDDFLTEYGLRERLAELKNLEQKLASGSDQMERLRVRSLKTEAETLLHPRGLGDFRVLRIAR